MSGPFRNLLIVLAVAAAVAGGVYFLVTAGRSTIVVHRGSADLPRGAGSQDASDVQLPQTDIADSRTKSATPAVPLEKMLGIPEEQEPAGEDDEPGEDDNGEAPPEENGEPGEDEGEDVSDPVREWERLIEELEDSIVRMEEEAEKLEAEGKQEEADKLWRQIEDAQKEIEEYEKKIEEYSGAPGGAGR